MPQSSPIKPYNELDWAVDSTLTAILGRGNLLRQARHVGRGREVRSDLRPRFIAWDATTRSKANPDGIYQCAMPGITKAV
ncbi:MAG: hypothetical protein WB773_10205 [Isosphaeraceae bacterium]